MAIKRKTYKGIYTDTNEVFVCDTISDLALLPADAPHGSSAFVIEDSTTWMIDSSGIWMEVQIGGSGGGGGGGDITLDSLSVTENGTYIPRSGHAYKRVSVNVSGDPPEPTDGKTHIWITIDDDTPRNRLAFYLYWMQTAAYGVLVDWGDGSAPESFSGVGAYDREHIYSAAGNYEIVMTVLQGSLTLEGLSGSSPEYAIYGSKANAISYSRARIKRISVGDNVRVGSYMAQQCYGLKRVSFPDTLITIGANAFEECYSLKSVSIQEGTTDIGPYAFSSCHSLESVRIPESVSTLGSYAFRSCYSISSIVLPSGLTSINSGTFQGCCGLRSVQFPDVLTTVGNDSFRGCTSLVRIDLPATVATVGDSAFLNCTGVSEYHFRSTKPPTLVSTSVFIGISSGCVIYVPYSEDHSVLNAYRAATNWSTYAGRILEEAE